MKSEENKNGKGKKIILLIIGIVLILFIIFGLNKDVIPINNNVSINNENNSSKQLSNENNKQDLQKQRELAFEEILKKMEQKNFILHDVKFKENSSEILSAIIEQETVENKYNWDATGIPEESYSLLDSQHKQTITSVYGPAFTAVKSVTFMVITPSSNGEIYKILEREQDTSLESLINNSEWEGYKYSWK